MVCNTLSRGLRHRRDILRNGVLLAGVICFASRAPAQEPSFPKYTPQEAELVKRVTNAGANKIEAYLDILKDIATPVDCSSISLRKIWLFTELQLTNELLDSGQWQQAIARAERLPNGACPWTAGWLAQWHVDLSKAYLRGGKQDLAQKHVQSAWELATANLQAGLRGEVPVNRSGVIEAHTAYARFLVATSFPEEAISVLNELLLVRFPTRGAETEQPGIPERVVARARVMLGLVYAQKAYRNAPGAEEQARAEYSKALASEDIEYIDLFSARTRLAHLDLEAGDPAAARLQLEAVQELEQTDHLRTRDRAWYSALWQQVTRETQGQIYPPFEEDCRTLLKQWYAEAELGSVGFMQYGRLREVQVEAIATALELEGPEEALHTALAWQDLGLLNQRLAPPIWSLDGIREILGKDDAVLVFASGKSSSFGFLLRKTGQPEAWAMEAPRQASAGATTLAETLANVCAGLSDPKHLEPIAAKTCTLLFPARIQEQLALCKNLIVLGRYQMDRVPLELLPIQGQPLGLRSAICDWPTPSLGLALTRESQVPVAWNSWVHVGEPDLHPSALANDPNAVPLKAPDNLRSNGHLIDLVGHDAQYSRIRAEPKATVLQIVSHGLQPAAGEWNSAFATTADGYAPLGMLTMRTLVEDQGFAAPPITLLGICRSQRGPKRFGDVGATQLGGGFLIRGSKSVLGSRADCMVYLETTYQMHEWLKQSLAAGERLDRALLFARQKMAEQGRHAGDWASIQILGSGNTHTTPFAWAPPPSLAGPWRWALGGLLLLSVCGWWIRSHQRSKPSPAP